MSEEEQILIDLLDDPSFNRWINGEAGRTEQKRWENWQQESPLHARVRKKADMLYNLPMEESHGGDLEQELKQLQERIDERNNIFQLPDKTRQSSTGYRWAVAASIALLIAMVAAITLFTQQQPKKANSEPLYSNVEVGYGEKANLKISDGSRIRLNANSTLRYSPEQFNRALVEVWLEGEAHFSITRNPDGKNRNFIVHTPDGDIHILGTRFNVNTRFDRTGVVLEEGSLEILFKDPAKGKPENFKLKPGQRAQFSSSQSDIQLQEVDTLLYTAWLDGKLEFKETPLSDLIKNIEQTYGVSVEVQDSTLSNKKISGSLRNPDLQTLLEGVEAVLNVTIVEQKDNLFLIARKQNINKGKI